MSVLIIMPLVAFTGRYRAAVEKGLNGPGDVVLAITGQESEGFGEPMAFEDIKDQVFRSLAKKILICGLSGSGKTFLAEELAPRIDAIRLNNDDIRDGPHAEIGWAEEARIEHAHKVGQWANMIVCQGHHVIVDMICPTEETRAAFDADFTIYVDTVSKSQYADTDALFVPPKNPDEHVDKQAGEWWAGIIAPRFRRRVKVVDCREISDVVNLLTNW